MPHSKANSSASKADRRTPSLHPALHSKISSPEFENATIANPPAEDPSPLRAPLCQS